MKATDIQLALMSERVYLARGGAPVSTDWVRVLKADEANLGDLKGYFGAAWYNRNTKELVLAHRGTDADSWQDWMSDAQLEITYYDLTYSSGISIVESAEGWPTRSTAARARTGSSPVAATTTSTVVGMPTWCSASEAGEDELGQDIRGLQLIARCPVPRP